MWGGPKEGQKKKEGKKKKKKENIVAYCKMVAVICKQKIIRWDKTDNID